MKFLDERISKFADNLLSHLCAPLLTAGATLHIESGGVLQPNKRIFQVCRELKDQPVVADVVFGYSRSLYDLIASPKFTSGEALF